jgi:hypothetical protein
MRAAITVVPATNASWMTRGLFSGQMDGTTSASRDASALDTLVRHGRRAHTVGRKKRFELAAIAVIAVIRRVAAEHVHRDASRFQLTARLEQKMRRLRDHQAAEKPESQRTAAGLARVGGRAVDPGAPLKPDGANVMRSWGCRSDELLAHVRGRSEEVSDLPADAAHVFVRRLRSRLLALAPSGWDSGFGIRDLNWDSDSAGSKPVSGGSASGQRWRRAPATAQDSACSSRKHPGHCTPKIQSSNCPRWHISQ